MNYPEIIAITLSNNDVALFVNGSSIYHLDGVEAGADPGIIGHYLAKALGVEFHSIHMKVPELSDWTWNDVYLSHCPHEPKHKLEYDSLKERNIALTLKLVSGWISSQPFDVTQSLPEHLDPLVDECYGRANSYRLDNATGKEEQELILNEIDSEISRINNNGPMEQIEYLIRQDVFIDPVLSLDNIMCRIGNEKGITYRSFGKHIVTTKESMQQIVAGAFQILWPQEESEKKF